MLLQVSHQSEMRYYTPPLNDPPVNKTNREVYNTFLLKWFEDIFAITVLPMSQMRRRQHVSSLHLYISSSPFIGEGVTPTMENCAVYQSSHSLGAEIVHFAFLEISESLDCSAMSCKSSVGNYFHFSLIVYVITNRNPSFTWCIDIRVTANQNHFPHIMGKITLSPYRISNSESQTPLLPISISSGITKRRDFGPFFKQKVRLDES